MKKNVWLKIFYCQKFQKNVLKGLKFVMEFFLCFPNDLLSHKNIQIRAKTFYFRSKVSD